MVKYLQSSLCSFERGTGRGDPVGELVSQVMNGLTGMGNRYIIGAIGDGGEGCLIAGGNSKS